MQHTTTAATAAWTLQKLPNSIMMQCTGLKYSIGAPVFKKVTVIWIYLNLNLLSGDEHHINRRIGRSVWEPPRGPSLSRSTWCFTGPWNLFQGSMFGSNASIEPPEALFVSNLYKDTFFGSTRVPAKKVLLIVYLWLTKSLNSAMISLERVSCPEWLRNGAPDREPYRAHRGPSNRSPY